MLGSVDGLEAQRAGQAANLCRLFDLLVNGAVWVLHVVPYVYADVHKALLGLVD